MYAPDPKDKLKRDTLIVCALVCVYVATNVILALHHIK